MDTLRLAGFKAELKFTPLEFETRDVFYYLKLRVLCKFTPLGALSPVSVSRQAHKILGKFAQNRP